MRSDFSPLVSIVIPVYNGANFMREAIDSALAQSYQNIEIVVVNDGSKDDGKTDEIAKSYGNQIRYFSKENGGCASALNLGIAKMTGAYFSWLSHDDVYYPDKISRQIEVLSSLENKSTVIYGGYEVIDSRSKPQYRVQPNSVLSPSRLDIPLLPLLRGLVHGCTMLVPKNYFEKIGTFDVSLPSTQDYDLWFKLFRVAPLKFDPLVLVQSRVHPDQGTHKIDKHLEECNALWSGFLDKLTHQEMIGMSGTITGFMKETAAFLKETPYKEAYAVAQKRSLTIQNEILISVIIPFYNRVAWTVEALESVLKQTHQNFEILLIDDGSTEDISSIKNTCANDKRIRYFRQKNSGPAKARNFGIRETKGVYIAFLDADDLFLPDKLATQLAFMEASSSMISHTSYQRIDLEGNVLNTVSSGTFAGRVFPAIIASCSIAMPTVMARKEIFQYNQFPEHFEIGEDVCLWISLTKTHDLGAIDGVYSRVRVGPSTAAYNAKKQLAGLLNIASFVARDSSLAQHERLLKSLLDDASALMTDNFPTQTSVVAQTHKIETVSRYKKFLVTLRNEGLLAALNRTLRFVRSRL